MLQERSFIHIDIDHVIEYFYLDEIQHLIVRNEHLFRCLSNAPSKWTESDDLYIHSILILIKIQFTINDSNANKLGSIGAILIVSELNAL